MSMPAIAHCTWYWRVSAAVYSEFHGRWIVTAGPFIIGSGKTKDDAEEAADRYVKEHGYPID